MWIELTNPTQIKTYSMLRLVTDDGIGLIISNYLVTENFGSAWTLAKVDLDRLEFIHEGVFGFEWDSFGYGWSIWEEKEGENKFRTGKMPTVIDDEKELQNIESNFQAFESNSYWFEKGVEAEENEDWENCILYFTKAIKINHINYESHLHLAYSYIRLNKLDFACDAYIDSYRFQTEIEWWDVMTFKKDGRTQARHILNYFGDAYRERPKDEKIAFCFIINEVLGASIDEANKLLGKLTSDNKLKEIYFLLKGDIAMYNRSLEEAITSYSKTININNGIFGAYIKRAKANIENFIFDEAINDYTKAIAMNPGRAQLYKERSWMRFTHFGDFNGGIADYSKAIRLSPNNADLYQTKINYETDFRVKRYNEALEDYNKLIELEPNNTQAIEGRARLLAQLESE